LGIVVVLGGLAAVELDDAGPFGCSTVEGDDVVQGAAGGAVELVVGGGADFVGDGPVVAGREAPSSWSLRTRDSSNGRC